MEGVNRVFGIAILVIVAAMLANLVANPVGTTALINGIATLWRSSLNAALGKPS